MPYVRRRRVGRPRLRLRPLGVRMRKRRRRIRGSGIRDWINKAGRYLKRTKLISTVGNALGAVGVPYAGTIGSIAGSLGYGRKSRRRRTTRRRTRTRRGGCYR